MKSIRKVLVAWLLVSVLGFVFTGCMNKEVVVATINGETVSEGLYRIFLWSSQRGLTSLQPNFWEMDSLEGKSPEEYAKDKALKSISYCVVVGQKAEELDVKLTGEEKTKIKEAVKKAVVDNELINNKYQIKQKDYEMYYTYATQNEKVLALLGESYEPNEEEINAAVSVIKENGEVMDEATIVHILFDTKNELGEDLPQDKKEAVYEKAKQVLEKALAGEDMNRLASQYSGDSSVSSNLGEYTFLRGNMEESVEKVAFDTQNLGKVYPELIETSMGYEIIKVMDIHLEDESSIEERAIQTIKAHFAEDELNQMCYLAEIQKTEVYDQIHRMTEEMEQ